MLDWVMQHVPAEGLRGGGAPPDQAVLIALPLTLESAGRAGRSGGALVDS